MSTSPTGYFMLVLVLSWLQLLYYVMAAPESGVIGLAAFTVWLRSPAVLHFHSWSQGEVTKKCMTAIVSLFEAMSLSSTFLTLFSHNVASGLSPGATFFICLHSFVFSSLPSTIWSTRELWSQATARERNCCHCNMGSTRRIQWENKRSDEEIWFQICKSH